MEHDMECNMGSRNLSRWGLGLVANQAKLTWKSSGVMEWGNLDFPRVEGLGLSRG